MSQQIAQQIASFILTAAIVFCIVGNIVLYFGKAFLYDTPKD